MYKKTNELQLSAADQAMQSFSSSITETIDSLIAQTLRANSIHHGGKT